MPICPLPHFLPLHFWRSRVIHSSIFTSPGRGVAGQALHGFGPQLHDKSDLWDFHESNKKVCGSSNNSWFVSELLHCRRVDHSASWLVGELTGIIYKAIRTCRLTDGSLGSRSKWHLDQLFGQNRHRRKIGAVSLYLGRTGSACNTMSPGSRPIHTCQVSAWSIQPFGHNTPTFQTAQSDRTDR